MVPDGVHARPWIPWAIFAGLFTLYAANGEFLPLRDASPSLHGAVGLLERGSFGLNGDVAPSLFRWTLEAGGIARDVDLMNWDEELDGVPARVHRDAGRLRLKGPSYALADTREEGSWVSIYGPGAAVTAVPFVAPVVLLGWAEGGNARAVWHAGKLGASAMAAASAAFLYLAFLELLTPRRAALVAVAYGTGTCLWSVASQSLWQQTPVLFFFSLGLWLMIRRREGWGPLFSGLCFGAAVACRPTALLVGAAAAGSLLILAGRRKAAFFALGALPFPLLLAVYNVVCFGSMFDFGQLRQTQAVAWSTTGSTDLWQTPLAWGIVGHLVSPSRGLLVYSPFLLFALWGFIEAWKRPEWRWLRPLSLGWVAILLVSSKWFSWWGGWSFAYRMLMDTLPVLVLGLLPVADRVLSSRRLAGVSGTLLGISILVHGLGAFAYDQAGWNARAEGVVVLVPAEGVPRVAATREEADRMVRDENARIVRKHRLDVNHWEFRHRLWSFTDNQVVYMLTHLSEARQARRDDIRRLTPSGSGRR